MPAELTIMCFDMKKKWTSMSVPLTADVNAVKSTHEVVFLNSRKCWILFLGPETKGKHTRLERFPTIMKEPQLPPTTAGMIQRHVQSPQPLRSRIVSANGPRKNQYYLAQSLFPSSLPVQNSASELPCKALAGEQQSPLIYLDFRSISKFSQWQQYANQYCTTVGPNSR